MLYHVSKASGLKILEPRVSTHGKAYVYAIENRVTGLLFGAKQDDFDFIISTDNEDRPILCECYPEALEKVYKNRSCSVYIVEDAGFMRGMTSWSTELVCDQPVAVCEEIQVPDLYAQLLSEAARGNLQIHRWQDTTQYKQQISAHIVDRLIRFQVDLDNCMTQDPRFSTYYREIILALRGIMDGHLL